MSENILQDAAMTIILNAGNARTKTNEALDYIAEKDFDSAKKSIEEARSYIVMAHQAQTTIIQDEARGIKTETTLLFTHAQDTLMTVMSEINITEKLIVILKNY